MLAYLFLILATCAELVAKQKIVDCYKVTIDSTVVDIRVLGVLDERNVWPSTLQQQSPVLYKLHEQGFFPSLDYLQQERDWVGVHIMLQPGDTIAIWNADWIFWYGDSVLVSEDYVTERDGTELITPMHVLRLPDDGVKMQKDGSVWFMIGFKKGTLRRLKPTRSGYLFDRPDSVTVVNRLVGR